MPNLKLAFNNFLLEHTGYVLTKLDMSGYDYRATLYKTVVDHYGTAIHGKILDTGSNYGSWAKETFGNTHAVITLDKQENADVQGDLLALPFGAQEFDCVFSFETIEHVQNPFVAIAEIRRVLKPGGLLVGSTPFIHEIHGEEYGDYWRITRQGWQYLLKDFREVEIIPFGRNVLMPHHYLFKGIV